MVGQSSIYTWISGTCWQYKNIRHTWPYKQFRKSWALLPCKQKTCLSLVSSVFSKCTFHLTNPCLYVDTAKPWTGLHPCPSERCAKPCIVVPNVRFGAVLSAHFVGYFASSRLDSHLFHTIPAGSRNRSIHPASRQIFNYIDSNTCVVPDNWRFDEIEATKQLFLASRSCQKSG